MPYTPHEVQPRSTEAQSSCPLQTKQPEPPSANTSSPNASDAIEEVPRDTPQRRTHKAARRAKSEKINKQRWEEIIRNLEVEKLLEERKNICTEEEKAKAWADVADTVKTYSDDMIERWNKQIDTYLVFAGLFSAILTAFNVQSYPLLQQTTPDPTVVALQQISLQLQSFAISPPFVNSTHPAVAAAAIPPSTPSPVPRYAIWLNVLWFSGLILSLASTVIGILVKQWIGEYSSGLTGKSREAARLRQYRLNNLVKWRVGGIIVLIPVLLLISLALFLAGLLVLLWNLHPTVAVVASVLVGVLAVATICVTLLPIFKPSCAYLSPQTLVLIPLFWHVMLRPARLGLAIVAYILAFLFLLPSIMLDCCIQGCFQYLLPRRQRWGYLVRHYDNIREFRFHDGLNILLDVFAGPRFSTSKSISIDSTWRGHERSVVNRLNNTLDIDILVKAYDSTLDANAVSSAAICLLEQPSGAVVDYSSRLYSCITEHFGYTKVYLWGGHPKNNLLAGQTLLCAANVARTEPFGLLYDTVLVEDLLCLVARLRTSGVVLSTGLSLLEDAWLQSVACSGASNPSLHRDHSHYDGILAFISDWRLGEASQDSLDERVHEFFEDTTHGRSRDIDILRRETDRCLRLATAPHVVQGEVVDNTNDKYYFKAYLDCLRTVDEYLWYAARVLGSTDSSPGLEDSDVIRQNTCDILRAFHSALRHLRDLGRSWRYRKGIFKHVYPNHLRLQCNILNTLNSKHEIFRSIGSFDRVLRSDICQGLVSFYSWMEGQKTRAGLRDTEADPSPEDLDAALARYKELYYRT